MADGFRIDVTELTRLAEDLGRTPAEAMPGIERILKATAHRTKTNIQAAFATSPHFKQVSRSVGYDRKGVLGYVGYEVGPDRKKHGAGALGGIATEGGANGGGGTVSLKMAEQQAEIHLVRDMTALMKEIL